MLGLYEMQLLKIYILITETTCKCSSQSRCVTYVESVTRGVIGLTASGGVV